jgi:hypothetical protein
MKLLLGFPDMSDYTSKERGKSNVQGRKIINLYFHGKCLEFNQNLINKCIFIIFVINYQIFTLDLVVVI